MSLIRLRHLINLVTTKEQIFGSQLFVGTSLIARIFKTLFGINRISLILSFI